MSDDRVSPAADAPAGVDETHATDPARGGPIRSAARRAGIAEAPRTPHPGADFEALPDDAVRPREVTVRPRYAADETTAWVSAAIEDTVALLDHR